MEAETPGSVEVPAKLEGEALIAKVQETLEGLLSKKNLVRDQFLASNMNPQMYIPVKVLLSHDKLIAVGATQESLAKAAANSTRLGIDDANTMVRPLLKSKRNVVILRDIPEHTTEEEIRGIFNESPYSSKIANIKAEVNNAWFVKFDLDEGTQEVVLWLRSQQFKGKTVNASIKSEHFLRSFIPAQQAVAPSIDRSPGPMAGIPPFMPGGKPGLPFVPPMMPGKGAPPAMPGLLPWMFPYKGGMPFPNVPGLSSQVVAAAAANVAAAAAAKGAAKGQFAARAPMVRQSAEERATASASLLELLGGGQFRNKPSTEGEDGKPEGSKKERKKKAKQAMQVPNLVEPLMAPTVLSFMPDALVPPSPPKPDKPTVLAQMSELLELTQAEAPPLGAEYKGSFRKYTRDQIVAVCQAMGSVAKPDAFPLMQKLDVASAKTLTQFEEPDPMPETKGKDSPVAKAKKKAQPQAQPKQYTPEEWAEWIAQQSAKTAPKKKAQKPKEEASETREKKPAKEEPAAKEKSGKRSNEKKKEAPPAPAMKWVAKKA